MTDRTRRGHKRGPTGCVTHSIKKPTSTLLGMPHLWVPQMAQALPKLYVPHRYPHYPPPRHPVASSLCACLMVAPASFGGGLVNMLTKPADSGVQGETTNLSFGFPIEEAKGHMAWCFAKSRESIQA